MQNGQLKFPSCIYGTCFQVLDGKFGIMCDAEVVKKVIIFYFFLCFRFSYHNLEHQIHLAESFAWKELPIRDPDTGNLTMRGYVVRTSTFTKLIWKTMSLFHVIQSTFRMLSSHDMMFPTWYPFDASVSPLYEITNFSQVSLHLYMPIRTKAETLIL